MNNRMSVLGLSASAVLFVALAVQEGYQEVASPPTKDDRDTVGIGSTFHADGSPVKRGDTIDPITAIQLAHTHLSKDEQALKKCIKAPLSQAEYDVLVDFAYQYGVRTACKSGMVRNINKGQYEASCHYYLRYRYAAGYDCSTIINGQRNKRCWGVWTRSQGRQQACLTGDLRHLKK